MHVNTRKHMPRVFTYYGPLQKLNEHVQQHLSEEISLREAAEIAGLEEKYFSKYFHEKTGVCFKDWIKHMRITRAMELMRYRNYLIIDVAFEVGFNDLRTFERAFKKCTGMTPSGFRRMVRPV